MINTSGKQSSVSSTEINTHGTLTCESLAVTITQAGVTPAVINTPVEAYVTFNTSGDHADKISAVVINAYGTEAGVTPILIEEPNTY